MQVTELDEIGMGETNQEQRDDDDKSSERLQSAIEAFKNVDIEVE